MIVGYWSSMTLWSQQTGVVRKCQKPWWMCSCLDLVWSELLTSGIFGMIWVGIVGCWPAMAREWLITVARFCWCLRLRSLLLPKCQKPQWPNDSMCTSLPERRATDQILRRQRWFDHLKHLRDEAGRGWRRRCHALGCRDHAEFVQSQWQHFFDLFGLRCGQSCKNCWETGWEPQNGWSNWWDMMSNWWALWLIVWIGLKHFLRLVSHFMVSFWGILGLFGLSQDRAHPDITLNRRGFAEDEAHRGRASGCLPSHKWFARIAGGAQKGFSAGAPMTSIKAWVGFRDT